MAMLANLRSSLFACQLTLILLFAKTSLLLAHPYKGIWCEHIDETTLEIAGGALQMAGITLSVGLALIMLIVFVLFMAGCLFCSKGDTAAAAEKMDPGGNEHKGKVKGKVENKKKPNKEAKK